MITVPVSPCGRRRLAAPLRCSPFLVLAASVGLLLSSCAEDGNFTVLGYTTAPNYDTNIHTVRVPIFKNRTMRDSSREGLEFEVTQAVIREIELKTPYKVVGADCDADTELECTITSFNKLILNRTQLNEVREAETDLTVEVVWRDLRTGDILTQPRRRPEPLPPLADVPGKLPPIPPATVSSTAGFIPELGETMATARKKNADRIAVQIVSMMEKPW